LQRLVTNNYPAFLIDVPLLLDVVLFPESFDSAGGVYQFLFTGKEGVAGRADFYLDVLGCRTCFDNIPAGAGYLCHFILGMNFFFHFILQKLSNSVRLTLSLASGLRT